MTSYTRNQLRRKTIIQQRFMGLVMILISAFVLWLASTGTNPVEQDCTAIFFTLPLGLWLLFSREIMIA